MSQTLRCLRHDQSETSKLGMIKEKQSIDSKSRNAVNICDILGHPGQEFCFYVSHSYQQNSCSLEWQDTGTSDASDIQKDGWFHWVCLNLDL